MFSVLLLIYRNKWREGEHKPQTSVATFVLRLFSILGVVFIKLIKLKKRSSSWVRKIARGRCQFTSAVIRSLRADWLIAPELIPGFCSMKRLGVFLLPLDGMLVHRRSFPRNLLGFPNNLPVPIYTPGWREALRVKCLAQEHNTVSSARTRTRNARSGDKRTNHQATATLCYQEQG